MYAEVSTDTYDDFCVRNRDLSLWQKWPVNTLTFRSSA